MFARKPKEMLAAVTRDLSVPVGTNVIIEALSYASEQLAGYYTWPWFQSEMTWTFRNSVTGMCTITESGVATFQSISDVNVGAYADRNWRLIIGLHDYPILTVTGAGATLDFNKIRPYPLAVSTPFRLAHTSLTLPEDFRPGSDFACYNTTLRYRIPHVPRLVFERYWQSYKQMISNTALVCTDQEPLYDGEIGWRNMIQFCPAPVGGTQVRIAYQRSPTALDFVNNKTTEWPRGYDEVLELLALGRIGEKTGDTKAIMGSRRAKGLIRQLRGSVATAVVDNAPLQNTSFGGAYWEGEMGSVLPRTS